MNAILMNSIFTAFGVYSVNKIRSYTEKNQTFSIYHESSSSVWAKFSEAKLMAQSGKYYNFRKYFNRIKTLANMAYYLFNDPHLRTET